ncbi:MAG: hypothetical protein FWC32_03425 [Firmicutes bacterium]|nr:hypothetical protein [Bacillota bacterium]
MDNIQAFYHHLVQKGKKQDYIEASKKLMDNFYATLGDESPSSEVIDKFVRKRWSGYVSRDRATYQILNDYADFCKTVYPLFSNAFREHIRETFEGEAKKATRVYKNAIAYIPQDTKIDPFFLGRLTNEEFVEAFKSLQSVIFSVYENIERSAPFDWGWPGWQAITAEGINQNRVMMFLDALTGSGRLDSDVLIVDKKRFGGYDICKPIAKAKQMLKGFVDMGFCIEDLDNKRSPVFTVSYPNISNLITVLCAYFKNRHSDCRVFSYRFVEDPAAHIREVFFLAKTDGEPENIRKIYYWIYDEAVKHGFIPMGYENMGCYVYKKGSKKWLLLGSGHSYHEDDFLHSPNYTLAAKVKFNNVFRTHPEKINDLMKRFPESFGRPWTSWCFKCKPNEVNCKNAIIYIKENRKFHHCGVKSYLYFHDPSFEDVKAILELYKLENNIKPM